jgi:hypothetical protein
MPKMPPVPSDNRSPKGPGADSHVEKDQKVPERENYEQQGRHGNTHQNTHHQGYQQDR